MNIGKLIENEKQTINEIIIPQIHFESPSEEVKQRYTHSEEVKQICSPLEGIKGEENIKPESLILNTAIIILNPAF